MSYQFSNRLENRIHIGANSFPTGWKTEFEQKLLAGVV